MNESENKGTSVPATPLTPAKPTQPVFPPIDATKPVPPVTPFPAWTWNTPVIPQFYWNVYSSEQRIRQICVEIGRIQAYLEYFAANSNAAHWYLDNRFTQVEARLTARVDKLEKELGEEVARLDKALEDETDNRVNADEALQAQIDATKTALEAETKAREDGDKKNADAIAKETTDREAGDAALRTDVDINKAAIAKETADRKEADAALRTDVDANTAAIAKETTDRKAGDSALRTDVDANKAAIAKETTDRKAADDQINNDLATETNARENADTLLGGRIDAEANERKAGDAALRTDVDANKAAIAKETTDRKAGDSALRTDVDANKAAIAKETADREGVDNQLTDDLATEANTRENADTALGGRIDAEATARQDADRHLGEQITTEHSERTHDVQTLTASMNRRPLATAITAKAGSGVTVESTESEEDTGTTVVIGSTWEGDFASMRNDLQAEAAARANADAGLEAKLNSEINERRHDDEVQNQQIAGKLAFGAVRAGDGITVVNDPDTTTATVSAEVTKAKLDEAIAGIPAYELPAATTDRLGGIKVGTGLDVTPDGTLNATPTSTGLETVSHDGTMTGDGTTGNPLGVKLNTSYGCLNNYNDGIAVNAGNGLDIQNNKLKVKPATRYTLGGVKVGTGLDVTEDGTLNATASPSTGLETVSHDGTMTGDGTAGNPLGVKVDTSFGGLRVDDTYGIAVNMGSGLDIQSNVLSVKPATDYTLGGVKVGTGLTVTEDGTLNATGAAGTSESVKVVYPQSTQTALGLNNTSGVRSVGEFLNFTTGVDRHGLPTPRFDVRHVNITKKMLVDDLGRNFQASDFNTVNGGMFDGNIVLECGLDTIIESESVFGVGGYTVACITYANFPIDYNRSLLLDHSEVMTFFPTSTDRASLAEQINSWSDNTTIYGVICIETNTTVLDIYSRYN